MDSAHNLPAADIELTEAASKRILRWIDTAQMPWEPLAFIPGFQRKLLREDPCTHATVQLQHTPAGFSRPIAERLAAGAIRHYHRTVTERHYFLDGDFPCVEWRDLADVTGQLVTYRRDMFLDRPPNSLHGLTAGTPSSSGSQFLVWNTGAGTAMWEPEAATETVELAPLGGAGRDDVAAVASLEMSADAVDSTRVPFTHARIFHVDELPWRPHPVVASWQIKTLAPPVKGSPAVEIVNLSAAGVIRASNSPETDGPAARQSDSTREERWLYVLEGVLSLQIQCSEEAALDTGSARRTIASFEGPTGTFLDLQPGQTIVSASASISAPMRTCRVLCAGVDLSSAFSSL